MAEPSAVAHTEHSTSEAVYRQWQRDRFAELLDASGVGAGAPAESILFVGDSWHDDIDGARAAGLRPVHIARAGHCPELEVTHDDVPCVPDARSVLDLL